MSIATEIARLQQAKADIAEAIVAKGGEVSGTIDNYAQAIEALPSGDDTMLLRAITPIGGDFVVPDGVEVIRGYAFYSSPVQSISFPQGLKIVNTQSLRGLTNVTKLDFPDSLITIGAQAIYFSAKINTLIFRSTVPPTLGSSAISGNASTLKIYVPDESVDAYKAATNWSTLSSKIHPLSEYQG